MFEEFIVVVRTTNLLYNALCEINRFYVSVERNYCIILSITNTRVKLCVEDRTPMTIDNIAVFDLIRPKY